MLWCTLYKIICWERWLKITKYYGCYYYVQIFSQHINRYKYEFEYEKGLSDCLQPASYFVYWNMQEDIVWDTFFQTCCHCVETVWERKCFWVSSLNVHVSLFSMSVSTVMKGQQYSLCLFWFSKKVEDKIDFGISKPVSNTCKAVREDQRTALCS